MHVYVNDSDLGQILVEYCPLVLGVSLGLCIVMWLFVLFIKNRENSKPMHTVMAKLLEKPIQQGIIEWYVVECEDGRRLKLRSFQSNHIIIAVGDVGMISYKGKTIQSFQREGKWTHSE